MIDRARALCVVLGLLLAACKSSGAEPSTAAAPAPTTKPAAAPTPASKPTPTPPASPEVICKKVIALGEKDLADKEGEEKTKLETMLMVFRRDCVKEASRNLKKDPAGYAKTVSCLEACTRFDDALEC